MSLKSSFLGQAYPVLLDLILVGHALADSTYTQTAQRGELPFVKRPVNLEYSTGSHKSALLNFFRIIMFNPSEGTTICKPSGKQFDRIYTVHLLGIYPR